MELNDLTTMALDAAEPALGDAPVSMVNFIWFRDRTEYPGGFEGAKADPRSAYYEGYAGAFLAVAQDLGIDGVEVVFHASRPAGLVAGDDDDWDDIVIVRYRSFADFRTIVESEAYRRRADPHRRASVRNWRLIATGA